MWMGIDADAVRGMEIDDDDENDDDDDDDEVCDP